MLTSYPIIVVAIALAILPIPQNVTAQEAGGAAGHTHYRHSIDLTPLSFVMGIYAVHYNYRITPRGEIIVAPLYMNIQYEDIGHTNAPGFIVGYRHYVWGNVHVDYQLMPAWDRFYEENEGRYYRGFDLWNEFRLGYTWDFAVLDIPAFINFQWPFGFALYSENKPESFRDHVADNPFFYFPPMFFFGVRF